MFLNLKEVIILEYLDIVDENGNKTGEIKERKDIHSKGYWHRGFHVWIINSMHEILLQRRSLNKDVYPNKLYASVAGHPISKESNLQAIKREFKEEIDLDLNVDELQYLFTFSQKVIENSGKFLDNMFYDVYVLEKNIDVNNLKLQKEEVSEVKYIHFKELEKMTINNHEDIVKHPIEWEKLFKVLHEKYDK